MTKREDPQRVTHFEGRALPRPDEDLEDQGLAFDVGTLLGRRRVLGLIGAGAATVGLAACGVDSAADATETPSGGVTTSAGGLGEIPDETAGPYPGDGSNGPDVLEESGIVRSDIRSSFGEYTGTAEGILMTLELAIVDLANSKPFAGVAVYVWHCDREGAYSLYSNGVTDQNYLRGVQVADENGVVRYTSIFPACYAGRWPHIHFEVYPDEAAILDSTNAIATSQVALPEDVCNDVYATTGYDASVKNLAGVTLASDNVFGEDQGALQLATVTGGLEAGYDVRLEVGVDTRTEPTGGGMPPGDGGGRPPGDGGGPPPGDRPGPPPGDTAEQPVEPPEES
ncbi:intradiol ring-cleavage dioxygenase [Tessaracoccus terricola]